MNNTDIWKYKPTWKSGWHWLVIMVMAKYNNGGNCLL